VELHAILLDGAFFEYNETVYDICKCDRWSTTSDSDRAALLGKAHEAQVAP
jgi:hypothetical protein